ncbi:ABC transporter permease [Aquihabitans sp. G128]|uniref:ABC transporter permease n=1 Tax=Aquihabitans sp. G128 TaxID=2849779 RepID=UPI001C22B138|nr:ABC transporter permease [Aquihabitans sp. G128]QXC59885.1 ABC transporter permease [Aquihabitans sp. G128]
MTTTDTPTPGTAVNAPTARTELDAPAVAYRKAFLALLARDLHVLLKNLPLFVLRTIMQPLLLMFVFTYVFPKIGQGVGGKGAGGEELFTAVLVAGVIGLAIVFQGIQAVALPLVQEFGYSKEIEDRVLAPLPTRLVGVQKIVTGMLQGLVAAALVFPIAAVVPATDVHLHIRWLVLLTMAPLAGWVAASLGLVLGTKVAPQSVSYLFALVVLPLTFLGSVYYPWTTLSPIRWLKLAVLVNPLVYMTEGFRAALVQGVDHMALGWIYGALVLFAVVLTWIGVSGFEKRVVT